ncbi:single-stranded DNA-binding protein [Clostridium botulinum]|uniref:single-stranded DNA-binding protein n=1 Tax=Clostridium botulinum TaxID=1491 RepID=UPI0004D00786|nr:single-stranded DNA-binding protein [Clostridium botulinum]
MNNCTFVGRITKELEIKTIKDNKILKFNLAVRRTSNKEKTDFIPVVVWGELASSIAKYSGKGKLIGIIGELHTNYFEKDEVKRLNFELTAKEVKFIEWNDNKINMKDNE